MNLAEIMNKKIITCSKDSNIKEISKLMKENDIGFIPISDQNKIIGVITDRDIVINLLFNKENNTCKVEDYITKNIVSIDVNSSIEETLKIMGKNKIKRVLVTLNNKIVGIISLSDIINSDYDSPLLLDTLKKIYTIKNRNDKYKTEIDEFYL